MLPVSANLRQREKGKASEQAAAIVGVGAAELEPLLGVEAKERMLAGKKIDPGANLPQGQGKASEQATTLPLGQICPNGKKARQASRR